MIGGDPPTPARAGTGMLRAMPVQLLTLSLDGITAADYLAHARDPEPGALDGPLAAVVVRTDQPLADVVEAACSWHGEPPGPYVAARLAGLPVTADVVEVHARPLDAQVVALHPGCPELGSLAA